MRRTFLILIFLCTFAAGALLPEDVHPDALWSLGVKYHEKKEYSKAAHYFARVAKEYPKHSRAKDAASRAGLNMLIHLKDKRATFAQNVILEQYQRLFLDNWCRTEEARQKLESDGLWMYNGELCTWIADRIGFYNPPKELEYRKRAEEAYTMIPDSSKLSKEAKYRQMVSKCNRLLAMPSDQVRETEARSMIEMCREQVKNIKADEKDVGLVKRAVECEFLICRINYQILRKKGVVEKIRALGQKWPRSVVIPELCTMINLLYNNAHGITVSDDDLLELRYLCVALARENVESKGFENLGQQKQLRAIELYSDALVVSADRKISKDAVDEVIPKLDKIAGGKSKSEIDIARELVKRHSGLMLYDFGYPKELKHTDREYRDELHRLRIRAYQVDNKSFWRHPADMSGVLTIFGLAYSCFSTDRDMLIVLKQWLSEMRNNHKDIIKDTTFQRTEKAIDDALRKLE